MGVNAAHKITLLSAAAATGSWIKIVAPGSYMPVASGTFDAATVGIELSLDGTNAIDSMDDVTFTAAGFLPAFQLGSCYLRGTITGGGAPSVSLVLLGAE